MGISVHTAETEMAKTPYYSCRMSLSQYTVRYRYRGYCIRSGYTNTRAICCLNQLLNAAECLCFGLIYELRYDTAVYVTCV